MRPSFPRSKAVWPSPNRSRSDTETETEQNSLKETRDGWLERKKKTQEDEMGSVKDRQASYSEALERNGLRLRKKKKNLLCQELP